MMAEFLFENPYVVGLVGALLTGLSLFGWIQTGNKIAAYVGLGFLLLTSFLVWLNLYVVTDREQIRVVLTDTSRELEENRHDAVKKRIHPDHTQQVASAVALLPRIKFDVATVTRVHSIELTKVGNKPSARVRMNVYVEVQTDFMPGKVPRWVQLDLEKLGDQWLVVDFVHKEATFEFLGKE
jgi:uncharacterized membrane protein YecN with MAPEG domain